MTVPDQHFEIVEGTSRILKVTVTGNIDLTLADSITWVLRRGPDSPVIVTKTVGSGVTVTGQKTMDVALPKSDTDPLRGSYEHECKVVAGPKTDAIFTGYLMVRPTLIHA